jgi:hypothetical protein
MKQHVIEMKNFRVLAWEDGEIIIEGKVDKIQDLVYITQEYQRIFGGIPFKVDTSEWRGMLGNG